MGKPTLIPSPLMGEGKGGGEGLNLQDFMFEEPIYLKTYKDGLLKDKIEKAFEILKSCSLCPRNCGIDRLSGETGICKTGKNAWVSSYNAHFGEEDPLVGLHGSGTIFFTHCNLLCNFCQNYDISHEGYGREVASSKLSEIMLYLQGIGCHNINFVTPSHVVPQILSAISEAAAMGLKIPLVYNTGGYDRVETLRLLENVIDIYMPDFKFWDPKIAGITCDAGDYPDVARKALIEMHRQTGDLILDENGIAIHGILVRHLVLPYGLAGTRDIMRFIANNISKNTYVNIMPQYRPCGRASEVKELSVGLSRKDYELALKAALEEGITRLDNRRRIFAAESGA
jgi:putative pyruvate formate lyase activating enzyme